MARNIEIKARVTDREQLLAAARAISDSGPEMLLQDDTFFSCTTGRLKLRVFANQSAQLIFYRRDDRPGPKTSFYQITPVIEPDLMRETLAKAYGIEVRVRKERCLYLVGETRIHIDRVDGLGDFMELEVVLRDDQAESEGTERVQSLMKALGIEPSQLVAGAYADWLKPPLR